MGILAAIVSPRAESAVQPPAAQPPARMADPLIPIITRAAVPAAPAPTAPTAPAVPTAPAEAVQPAPAPASAAEPTSTTTSASPIEAAAPAPVPAVTPDATPTPAPVANPVAVTPAEPVTTLVLATASATVADPATAVTSATDLAGSDFLTANGLNYAVCKVGLRTTGAHVPDTRNDPVRPDFEPAALPKDVAVIRDDTLAVLGVVGADFTPCQNRFMQEALVEAGFPGRCAVTWAGPLYGGATVLVQMSVNGVDSTVDGRRLRMGLDVANGHTGDRNFEAIPRLILPGGGQVSMFGGGGAMARAWRVSHRSGIRKAVADLSKVWGGTIDLMAKSMPTIERLVTTQVDTDVLKTLLVATMQRVSSATTDPALPQKYAEKLMEDAAITNFTAGTKTSLFDLLDRVATFVDTARKVRSGKDADRDVRRRESSLDGQGARVKAALLKEVLSFASVS